MASATAKEMEIKLTNVARPSLEDLLIDYEDFLRTGKRALSAKNHRLLNRLRELIKTRNANDTIFQKAIEHENPEICANTIITLITITSFFAATANTIAGSSLC